MKVNDKVKVHMYSFGKEIETRIYDQIFTVYEKDGKLGIDYNTEKSPYTCNGDIFTPFETFSNTVVFENIETGEKYHYSNVKNGIETIS